MRNKYLTLYLHPFAKASYYGNERCEGRSGECSLVTDATATGFFSSSLFLFLQATTDAAIRTPTTAAVAVIRTTVAAAATD